MQRLEWVGQSYWTFRDERHTNCLWSLQLSPVRPNPADEAGKTVDEGIHESVRKPADVPGDVDVQEQKEQVHQWEAY